MLLSGESIKWMAFQLKTKEAFAEAMMNCVVCSYNDLLDHSHTWRVELLVSRLGRVILAISIVPMGDDFETISKDMGGVYVRKYWRNEKNIITDSHN